MTVRLTKKRLAALDAALSIDDILWAKYQQMMRRIDERERRFRARHVIRKVEQLQESGFYVNMQILQVHDTDGGLVIIVR